MESLVLPDPKVLPPPIEEGQLSWRQAMMMLHERSEAAASKGGVGKEHERKKWGTTRLAVQIARLPLA
jgi:hypothetical protein